MIPRPRQQLSDRETPIPLRAGAGLFMGSNPLGMWVGAPITGGDFRHPFRVFNTATTARVDRGLILAESGIEPVIGSVPISGNKNSRQPELKLDAALVNERGESYVCVEVTPDSEGKVAGADGKLLDGALVEVVQSASPYATTGPKGRAPLALLLFTRQVPQVVQIAMFHLRYETTQPAEGPRRHYFL